MDTAMIPDCLVTAATFGCCAFGAAAGWVLCLYQHAPALERGARAESLLRGMAHKQRTALAAVAAARDGLPNTLLDHLIEETENLKEFVDA